MKWILLILACFTPFAIAEANPASRPLNVLEKDLSLWLRKEATTKDPSEHEQAIIKLTDLYREIMTDPRLPTSPTLNSFRFKLRFRLISVLKTLQTHMRRGTMPNSPTEASRLQDILQRHLQSSGSALGGGARMLQPNAGPGMPDYGPALVNLIQKTISPEFWDVNGGPGVIVYYPPLRLLVIRATSNIHYQIGGLR